MRRKRPRCASCRRPATTVCGAVVPITLLPARVQRAIAEALAGRLDEAARILCEIQGDMRARGERAVVDAASGLPPTCGRALCDRCAAGFACDEILCPRHTGARFLELVHGHHLVRGQERR